MSLMRHNLPKYGGLSGTAVLARCDCDMDKVQVLLSPPGVSDREFGIPWPVNFRPTVIDKN